MPLSLNTNRALPDSKDLITNRAESRLNYGPQQQTPAYNPKVTAQRKQNKQSRGTVVKALFVVIGLIVVYRVIKQ